MTEPRAPLFERLVCQHEGTLAAFHMPGHKGGRGASPAGAKYYQELLKLDLTELAGLDDLHHPQGVILEAQQLAARLFRAEQTFFLVNGTTSGNLAMVLAVCNAGDKLIVERNAHKSIINGLLLAGARPVYVAPEFDQELGIARGVTLASLQEALAANPDAKGVLITSPNYYGYASDVAAISELVHHYNMPLLVDEAHGAHYGFHPDFPLSAMMQGADIAVQSTHKMLSAMGMGSMLHVSGDRIDRERLSMFLAMVQSSSPSYPIMASLDLTRAWIETSGSAIWDEALAAIVDFQESMKGWLIELELVSYEPLKLIIHLKHQIEISGRIFTGEDLNQRLMNRGIYVELVDYRNALCLFSAGTTKQELDILGSALIELDQELGEERARSEWGELTKSSEHSATLLLPPIDYSFQGIDLSYILKARSELVPLAGAKNRRAAEMITPYPPGIPVIQLGERVTSEMIDYLSRLLDAGMAVNGVRDPGGAALIKVIIEEERE